jgi:hypothetical protein
VRQSSALAEQIVDVAKRGAKHISACAIDNDHYRVNVLAISRHDDLDGREQRAALGPVALPSPAKPGR